MGLSRLENFLKNVRGNILYVSPNDLDATDLYMKAVKALQEAMTRIETLETEVAALKSS